MAPILRARHPRKPVARFASPRYPSLRQATVAVLAGLVPLSAAADTGDTGDTGLEPSDTGDTGQAVVTPGAVDEDQAWEAIRLALQGYAWAEEAESVELVAKGEPWHSARVMVDSWNQGAVMVAFEESEDGVDAMIEDPWTWVQDHSCLLLELEGECRKATCGVDLAAVGLLDEACGVVGVFPYGAHSYGDADSMELYDEAAGEFVEWSQAYDFLLGWGLIGCGCAITEGPASEDWYALLATVMGMAALIRRRRR
jgi:MYXO-CTERM domain-containing protein